MQTSEFELIKRLTRKIPRSLRLEGSVSDDAGLLKMKSKLCVLSTDTLVEGVDFRSAQGNWAQIGRKALAVNLSDHAAMGAEPVCFTVALGIPESFAVASLETLYAGMMALARQFKVLFASGDISKAKTFFIAITVVGSTSRDKPVMRHGARPGDWLAVTGELGGSILGRHFDFEPRVLQGVFLRKNFRPTAMIDISDGLLQDLEHLLRASRVSCRLHLEAVPVSGEALKQARGSKALGRRFALTDGEDFELLLSVPPGVKSKLDQAWKRKFPKVKLSWLGRMRAGSGEIEYYENQKKINAPHYRTKGFQHF